MVLGDEIARAASEPMMVREGVFARSPTAMERRCQLDRKPAVWESAKLQSDRAWYRFPLGWGANINQISRI